MRPATPHHRVTQDFTLWSCTVPRVLLALLFTVLALRPALGQDAWNCTLLGATETGSYSAVAMQADLVLVGSGNSMEIVDFSDPARPRRISTYTTNDFIAAITWSGDHVFLANLDAGLRILDLADPAHPAELGFYDTPGLAYDVAVVGDVAYVGDAAGGLRVLDVGDPAHPQELAAFATAGVAGAVAVGGDRAFVAVGDGGVQEIDVGDPTNPILLRYLRLEAGDVALGGDRLYVLDWENGLHIFDTGSLSELGHAPFDFGLRLTVANDVACVARRFGGLSLVDVTNSANPVLVGNFYGEGYYADVAQVEGRAAFVAEESGLVLLNLETPAQPQEMGCFATWIDARDVVVDGSRAFVASGATGMHILDVSDPAHPAELGAVNTPCSALRVAVDGDRAYVADYNGGARIIAIGNPTQPSELGSYQATYETVDVATCGSRILTVHPGIGLRVVDVDDPTHPTVRWSQAGGETSVVTVAGDRAFLGGDHYFRVLDVSNPDQPEWVGGNPQPPCVVNDIAVLGEMVILAIGDDSSYCPMRGLLLIDLGGPQGPEVRGQLELPSSPRGVAASGDRIYVADGYFGLRIIDTHDPTQPVEVGFYESPGNATCVALANGLIYLADGLGGLLILRDDSATAVEPASTAAPATCALLPNVPNPFNPTTTLAYELATPQEVRLRVFDAAGRLVRELASGRQPAGVHEAAFDGSGLASGVYVAELRAGDMTMTQKMLLLK